MQKKRATLIQVPSCWCVHDDHWFLEESIRSFLPAGPATVFVSRTAWNGSDGCWERCVEAAESAGAEVVVGDWPDESVHRRAALAAMKERGHCYVFIPDGDEIVEPALLDKLVRMAAGDIAGAVRVHMATYWKSPHYRIHPPERLAPILLLDVQKAVHDYIREYDAGTLVVLGPDHGVLHHLSYAGPNERIARKLSTWGHRQEVAGDWYRRVWLGWDINPLMRSLHPTHPEFYGYAERIDPPEILKGVSDTRSLASDPTKPKRWPTVSIVIPLHGGPDDIRNCLASLGLCKDLVHELIVVDDASPDEAPDVVDQFPLAKLLRNEANLGFAATCNRGYAESTGEVVIFLNSDTRVPRAGLIRLVESVTSSGTVGAAGPMMNFAGYHHRVDPTYSDISNLDLFARDFAARDVTDEDVAMLVGFCLAVRRSAIEELGEEPFDTRFGRGLFEDNDLCYRLLRAGYRLRLATRSFVFHEGSKSLARSAEHPTVLLRRNQQVYFEKWKDDLESGFASHLSGQSAEPIQFREDRRPERRRKEIKQLARLADISLCMIVKNEERVLGACLDSVQDVFTQVLVVDTGSSDKTRDIVREHGAELYEIEWPNSFSEARNESLKHATGKWMCWLDADDTLPRTTAEAILQAVLTVPPEIIAFVVPVQFVEEGPNAGTRVDHVKVFRNLPGIRFTFHIHEQILPSLREHAGEIGRIDQPVLHSGYDVSVEGQKKKRERDWPLLLRDLEENPGHPFVLFNCGMTAHYEGEHPKAIEYLLESIAASGDTDSHLRKAYALLGNSRRISGDKEGALADYLTGIERVGEDPELRFLCALTLTDLDRLEEAREMYLAVSDIADDHFSSRDIALTRSKRSFNLGTVSVRLGRYAEGRDWLRRAADEDPTSLTAVLFLFEAALEFGDMREARVCAERFMLSAGANEIWTDMQIRLAAECGETAVDAMTRLHRDFPHAQGPAILVAREHLARGDIRSAEPLLERLAANGCSEASYHLGVLAVQRGDFNLAHRLTLHAHQLDPTHEQTLDQLTKLQNLLASEAGSDKPAT